MVPSWRCRTSRFGFEARIGWRCGSVSNAGDMPVNGTHQRLAAFSSERRDLEDGTFPTRSPHKILYPRLPHLLRDHVQLVEDNPAWLAMQCRVVLFQFGNDGTGLRNGVNRLVERRQIDHMQQQLGS